MKVPKALLEKYEAIAPLIIDFCKEHLNDEYAAVSLLMLEKLCRKRPSPLLNGKPNTWACGIIYAIGSVNFLFDKTQAPHMRAAAIAEKFGISQSTAGNKAGDIKKLLDIGIFDPEWTLPSKLGSNPMVWMFESSNGFVFDARHAPREVQEELFYTGMIPFIPADRANVPEKNEDENMRQRKADTPKPNREQKAVKGQLSLFGGTPASDPDEAEPPVKPLQPIIKISGAASVESLVSIDDYCESNLDYKKILAKFSNGYIKVYNKRKASLRNEVNIYLRRNFNTWYYSRINLLSQLSPARFINSDILCKYGTGAVAYPVCQPVFSKSKMTGIEFLFHVFTIDDHPFISDMQLFLDSARSIPARLKHGAAFDSIFSYAVLNFEYIADHAEFTFKEKPYIMALGEVCERLSLISLSKTGDGITFHEDEIAIFFSLPGREKLVCVIDEFAARFVECFDEMGISGKRPDEEDVLRVLQEENSIEDFLESLFGSVFTNLLNNIDSLTDADCDPDAFFESLDEGEIKAFLEAQAVLSVCCSHFFLVFGQYLQMIQPEHTYPFVFSKSDDDYLEALEYEEEDSDNPYFKMQIGAMVYYIPPGGYCLTPLGADWFGIDLSGQEDSLLPHILPGYYREALDGMMEDHSDSSFEGFMRQMLSDPEKVENLISMFEDFVDE